MKQLTTYNRATQYLNRLFDLINQDFFESELSKPTLTIQSTPHAYGHFTLNPCTWASGENGTHEINIGAGTLNRPIEETVATLIHEMVHYYCYTHGIKDTSRGCTYHNKNFKQEAEKRGLEIGHHPTYGWTITKPTDELLQWCIDNNLEEIKIGRNEFCYTPPRTGGGAPDGNDTTATGTKPTSTRKYQCPQCKCSVRATKEVHIMCADCMKEMVRVK